MTKVQELIQDFTTLRAAAKSTIDDFKARVDRDAFAALYFMHDEYQAAAEHEAFSIALLMLHDEKGYAKDGTAVEELYRYAQDQVICMVQLRGTPSQKLMHQASAVAWASVLSLTK